MKPWCFRAHTNSLLDWEMVHFASLLFRNSSFALGFNSKGKLVRDAEDLTTPVVRDTVVAKAYAPLSTPRNEWMVVLQSTPEPLKQYGYRESLNVPMLVEKRCLGTLMVVSCC